MMRHSVLALPALLRTSVLLATASQHAFSVNDDILAYPQYEVHYSTDYVLREQADQLLNSNAQSSGNDDASDYQIKSQVQAYRGVLDEDQHHEPSEDEPKERVSYERLILENMPYLCEIPQVTLPKEESKANATMTKAEEQRELARAIERGWELLSGMEGNCVYFISGWWSYRFCYREGVKQFHQLPPGRGVPPFPPVEDPSIDGYYLGSYKSKEQDKETKSLDADMPSDGDHKAEVGINSAKNSHGELVQRGESRYLVQQLGGGTLCDLTGKERKIEIQFHCNPLAADRISLIKETSTCTYLMIIQTPRLCSDVAFMPPQKDHPNMISCSPILESEDDAARYVAQLRALDAADSEEQIWAANPDAAAAFGVQIPPQIVGDIVIGGNEIVPRNVKLEKGAIVGGGKETYVETVANSAGILLTQEQIKKLGLGDRRSIETLSKELERRAKGAKWKLDVVDTPKGREYRGIIGEDDEHDDSKDETKEDKAKSEQQDGSEEEYFKEEL